MSFNCYYIRTADFNFPTGGGQEVEITRDNYEAYFVMYVDDELNAEECVAVEQFVQQNPDLEEELVMLQQSVLRPDDSIVFEQKENLFKHAAGEVITHENCEEYFVLYGDDELTNEEKDSVEQFVYKHPQYQADFELIQQVKLVPDNALAFPDKSYLYRSEEDDARVIAFPWWRFSAAAIAILTLGGVFLYLSTHISTGDKVVVLPPSKTNIIDKSKVPQAEVAVKPQHETNEVAHIKTEQVVAKNPIRKNISKPSNIQEALYVQQEKKQQPEEAPAGDNEKPLSGRLVGVAVSNSYKRPEVTNTVIKNTVSQSIVTTAAAIQPDEEPDNKAILTASVSKTPLRGFFRKVSRVVDKVTSPDENGNDKAGIRIANLAFSLK